LSAKSDDSSPPREPGPVDSSSEISNPEISNPASSPNPQSAIQNPQSADLIVSTADDAFRITPEERRRRELHRALVRFGLLKPDGAFNDST
jgi:hypothetical protein